jgi:hypothetical protein
MAIAYSMSVADRVLHVKASGKDESVEDVQRYGMAIIDMAVAHGIERALCDETALEYTLGTFSSYEAAKFIAEAAPKICRVAIVCSPRDLQNGAFWETIAVNRGLNVRVTSDLDQAREWVAEGLNQSNHAMDGDNS